MDTDDLSEEQRNGSITISTQANLLASLLRLGMLRIYRSRKSSSLETGNSSSTRLLAPVVAYMHYQAFCQHLFRILEGFQQALHAAGVDLEIRKSTGGLTGGLDWEGFMGKGTDAPESGERQSNLKGNVELLVDRRYASQEVVLQHLLTRVFSRAFCTILLSTEAHLTIVFSHTTFNSQDIAQLPLFLGQELRREILSIVVDELKSTPNAIKFHVDDIAGVIKTRSTKM